MSDTYLRALFATAMAVAALGAPAAAQKGPTAAELRLRIIFGAFPHRQVLHL